MGIGVTDGKKEKKDRAYIAKTQLERGREAFKKRGAFFNTPLFKCCKIIGVF